MTTLHLSKVQLQGLNHCVSALMVLSKPTDDHEILNAIESAYELLHSLQDAKPMKDSLLLTGALT